LGVTVQELLLVKNEIGFKMALTDRSSTKRLKKCSELCLKTDVSNELIPASIDTVNDSGPWVPTLMNI
jgi:hypothetical protein